MTRTEVRPLDVTRATVAEIKQAIADKVPLIGISCFGTHDRPDIDELAGIAIIQTPELGINIFPNLAGKNYLRLRIITQGEVRKLGEDAWYKLLQEGCLAIGIAGGPLDDHGEGMKTSATQKVAEFLGVEKKPWLKQLLGYVNHEDNSGKKTIPDGFSGPTGPMIKATWRLLKEDGRMDEMTARAEVFIGQIKLHLVDQKRFEEAKNELKKKIRLIPLTGMKERTLGQVPQIAVIKSDGERACAITRYLHNRHRDLVVIVQIQSSGNFQIHSAKEESVSTEQMDEVVSSLRLAFIDFLNKNLPAKSRVRIDWEESVKDGEQKDTEEIFYYRNARMIFNGTLTQEDVPGLIGEDPSYPFSERSLTNIIISALEECSQKAQVPQTYIDEEAVVEIEEVQEFQREGTRIKVSTSGSGFRITITEQ